MSNTLDDNTLNIIGVLSYKIDDIANCSPPEYYFPNFNMVEQTNEDEMYASGLFKSTSVKLNVNDIKSTNMLGRKDLISSEIVLSSDNILLSGENLNKYPKSRDSHNKYAQELWKLVEFVTTDKPLDILNTSENKIYINSTKAILEQNAALYKKVNYEQINIAITWFVYFDSTGVKKLISSEELKTSDISNNQLIGPFKTKTDAENFGNSNA